MWRNQSWSWLGLQNQFFIAVSQGIRNAGTRLRTWAQLILEKSVSDVNQDTYHRSASASRNWIWYTSAVYSGQPASSISSELPGRIELLPLRKSPKRIQNSEHSNENGRFKFEKASSQSKQSQLCDQQLLRRQCELESNEQQCEDP